MAYKIYNCVDPTFDGIYCESTRGYFYNGAFIASGTKYIYENRSDSNKKIFYEPYDGTTRGSWVLAENYDGFNDIAYKEQNTQFPQDGRWTGCSVTNCPCDSSSSSSSISSSSSSHSSISTSHSSSSSVDPILMSAFQVIGMTNTIYNGVYCARNMSYYEKGIGFIRGGSRMMYTHKTNPDLAMFFIDYSTGYWLLASRTGYTGANSAAHAAGNLSTPVTGSWGTFCTVVAVDCSSSSSSCSCSSSSCSSSSSFSSSDSSSDSSSNSLSSSSCSSSSMQA